MLLPHLLLAQVGSNLGLGDCMGCCDANVVNFGADPTGGNNSTLAFQKAYAATTPGQTICVPGGTYRVNPDTILLDGRRWVGNTDTKSVIFPAAVGDWLARNGPGAAFVENIVFDGLGDGVNRTERGIFTEHNVNSIYFNTWCMRHVSQGWDIFDSAGQTFLSSVAYNNGGVGFSIRNTSGSTFVACQANSNLTHGIYWEGANAGGGAAGASSWYGGLVDFNAGDAQILINGGDRVHIDGPYVEGVGDGIRLENNSRNCTFKHIIVVGGEAGRVAFRLVDASLNTFYSCAGPIIDPVPALAFNRYLVLTNGGQYDGGNEFYGSHAASTAQIYMEVWFDNGAGTTYRTIARREGLHCVSGVAPTFGPWQRGQKFWNELPAAGGKVGIVCVTGGTPGTWKDFGPIDA